MTQKETYLYFAEDLGGDASGDSVVVPASLFLGIDPISAETSRISFKSAAGTAVDDDILITHATGKYKQLCEAMAVLMNSSKNGLVVVFDEDNLTSHPLLDSLGVAVTECNITLI